MPPSRLSALLLAVTSTVGCQRARGLEVLAAASLTDSLPQVAQAFGAAHPGTVQTRFDSTARLASQLRAGAPADVFISADAAWLQTLTDEHLIDPASAQVLLHNRLVVAVPAGAAEAPSDMDALAAGTWTVGLAGEHVPAGRYARAAIRSSEPWRAIEDRSISGQSVRTVLAWVARGELQAGFVYATDAAAEPGVRVAFVVPEDLHPPVDYVAGVPTHATDPARAAAFIDWCAEDPGGVFAKAGFSLHNGTP